MFSLTKNTQRPKQAFEIYCIITDLAVRALLILERRAIQLIAHGGAAVENASLAYCYLAPCHIYQTRSFAKAF